MKFYIFIFALLLQSGMTSVFGQIRLSDMELCSIDSIQRNRIRYFSPGKGGNKRVWDFSKKLISKESSKVMFVKDSTGLVSVIEPGKIKYYQTISDTLFLMGSESSLEKREYINNKFSKKFPLEYCDSVKKTFRCEGMYCGDHPFRETGTTMVKVDGMGSIILAENDTVKNVKRVHTIDTYSKCMDINVAALDTARLVQVIDEKYEWYLPESEYPIIELFTSTTYHNMDITGTTRSAFCNLPENMTSFYVTEEDDGNEASEGYGFEDCEMPDPDIIHYKIDTQGDIISINYDLDEDANISIIVANHMGISYRHKTLTQTAGQAYSMQIDCNGLRPGTYILYINVNGKIYCKKVTL